MKKHTKFKNFIIGILIAMVTLIPFSFIFLNSMKSSKEAGLMKLSFPTEYHILENYSEVLRTNNYMILRGFFNSLIITICSILIIVIVSSMSGYVLQRKSHKKFSKMTETILLFGLMLPPAILPTIWILNLLNLFPTIPGMILIETALRIPFSVMLYRSYMYSVPREMEEAAVIEGAGSMQIFIDIIFPQLKPINITVIILSFVAIFNDFVNPLYFLPGAKNITLSQTLYHFMGQYESSWNLLFANVVLSIIPTLIIFIIFNKHIDKEMQKKII